MTDQVRQAHLDAHAAPRLGASLSTTEAPERPGVAHDLAFEMQRGRIPVLRAADGSFVALPSASEQAMQVRRMREAGIARAFASPGVTITRAPRPDSAGSFDLSAPQAYLAGWDVYPWTDGVAVR